MEEGEIEMLKSERWKGRGAYLSQTKKIGEKEKKEKQNWHSPPPQRPKDYFAEMAKTDDHMRKVLTRWQ